MAGVESAENGENFVKTCDDEEEKQQNGSKALDNYEEVDNKEQIFDFDSEKVDGFCTDDDVDDMEEYERESEMSKIQALEEEHENLLSSLMALTTHFAQVQLRLHQVIEAPEKERDALLKKLEDFADRGIPNYNEANQESDGAKSILTNIDSQKSHQNELMEQLKTQLEDLEKYAYESGQPILPQAIIVERQKIIIDELKRKMNLNLSELDLPQLSPDELRSHVDSAIGEFVSPLKMKEQLITQLKTQVNDLERFVKFEKSEKKQIREKMMKKSESSCSDVDLHNQSCNCNFDESLPSSSKSAAAAKASTTAVATNRRFNQQNSSANTNGCSSSAPPSTTATTSCNGSQEQQQITFGGRIYQVLNKASTIFQIFALSQMGCASQNGKNFKRNILKKTTRGNHWGDLRAKLEVDIQEILALVIEMNRVAANEELLAELREKEEQTEDDDVFIETNKVKQQQLLKETRYRSSSSSSAAQPQRPPSSASFTTSSKSDELKSLNIELITLVRKRFAVTLQKLIQHGLRSVNETRHHLVPFMGCFSSASLGYVAAGAAKGRAQADEDYTEMHAWELILKYYNLKNGDFYTETPAQKLSQSFNLDIVADGFHSNKQKLLMTIKNIINLHTPYRRSFNSHFKAFVCAGLNSHLLAHWLNTIFTCHGLITNFYTDWAYIAQTGGRDALKSIDQLTKHEFFDLPVDLAIRNLANINDVF